MNAKLILIFHITAISTIPFSCLGNLADKDTFQNTIQDFLENLSKSPHAALEQIAKYLHQNSTNTSRNGWDSKDLDMLNSTTTGSNLETLAKYLGPLATTIVERSLVEAGIHQECIEDMMLTATGIIYRRQWAMRMLDSIGKPGSELMNMHLKWLGSYEECTSVTATTFSNDTVQSDPVDNFHGKYCRMKATIDSAKVNILGQEYTPSVDFGVCVADSCSAKDIEGIILSVIRLVNESYEESPVDVECQEEKSLTTDAIVVICILSILGVLIVLGTVYDVVAVQLGERSGSDTKSRGNKKSSSNGPVRMSYDVPFKSSQVNGAFIGDAEELKTMKISENLNTKGVANSTTGALVETENSNTNGNARVVSARTTVPVTEAEKRGEKLAERGTVEKMLLSFSIYTNGVKILSTQQAAGSLGAVNGIRFISMAWIILGHTYSFSRGFDGNFMPFFMDQINNWTFMAITNATVSVDSFFALSGLLVGYLTLRELKKVNGVRHLNWLMFYFHRFWRYLANNSIQALLLSCTFNAFLMALNLRNPCIRCHQKECRKAKEESIRAMIRSIARLTPPYMLVLMVYAVLMKYWLFGPQWPQNHDKFAEPCSENWWVNLLYVNNFVRTDKLCMGWSWYLSNDMQFYILSPLILIPLFYQVVVGGLVSLLFLTVTVVTSALIVFNHRYPGQIFNSYVPTPKDQDYGKNLYLPCYTRMGPYIIGLFTGYLLYRLNCKCRIPKVVNLACWTLCIGICCAVTYSPYSDDDSHVFTVAESAAYVGLMRTAWGVAVCWVVFACATGHGGWINELLSWKPFVPLGRLTYMAYLIHPIVMLNYYMSRQHLVYFTQYELIYLFLGHLVMAYGVGFVASLVFEAPMMGLEKAIFRRNKSS